MFLIESISRLNIRTALREFGSTVRSLSPFKQTKKSGDKGDEFNYSDSKPRTSEERTNTAVMKANEANDKVRIVAEINRSAEINSTYDKLLPEYAAYINPELTDLTPVSEGIISATYKGKPVEIRSKILDDGNTEQEINFDDGSKIRYVSFINGGTMKINEEEFEMPAGTIAETKSVNGRIFSQLIQIPNSQRKVINKPEYLDKVEQMTGKAE